MSTWGDSKAPGHESKKSAEIYFDSAVAKREATRVFEDALVKFAQKSAHRNGKRANHYWLTP
jgi:hypothetical protein